MEALGLSTDFGFEHLVEYWYLLIWQGLGEEQIKWENEKLCFGHSGFEMS